MDEWSASKPAPPPVYIQVIQPGEEGGMSPSRNKNKTC